jgi:hypothetical protein
LLRPWRRLEPLRNVEELKVRSALSRRDRKVVPCRVVFADILERGLLMLAAPISPQDPERRSLARVLPQYLVFCNRQYRPSVKIDVSGMR